MKGYENIKSYINRLYEYEVKKQEILLKSESAEEVSDKLKALVKKLKT